MADSKRNKITSYFSEIKKELFERTVWPSRQDVLSQTVVVIVLLILASIGLGFVDYSITFITKALFEGNLVSTLISSKVTLISVLVFFALFVIYFAVRYVRKNRYNR